jgi:hypothetical protein
MLYVWGNVAVQRGVSNRVRSLCEPIPGRVRLLVLLCSGLDLYMLPGSNAAVPTRAAYRQVAS